MIDLPRLLAAFQKARHELLAQRVPAGHWEGEVSSSPLTTAAGAGALAIVAKQSKEDGRREAFQQLAARAVEWLAGAQSIEGGWGDVRCGRPTLSSTMLVHSTIHLAGQSERFANALSRSQDFIDHHGGLAKLREQNARDPALLAAVLGTSALAGLSAWRDVPALAFELAWAPRVLRRPPGAEHGHVEPIRLGMGLARFFHRWPRNPIALLVRSLSAGRGLKSLARMQPTSGGFLESATWTSFLLMGLAATGREDRPLARRALAFLLDTVRADASWPHVVDRGVANTAFAINALASASGDVGALGCLDWLLNCQRTDARATPSGQLGGWASSDGDGSLPDTGSTAAVLLALSVLLKSGGGTHRPQIEVAATAGTQWLLGLQNDGGGWPTYIPGENYASLDGGSPELTAQALRALRAWQYWIPDRTIDEAIRRGMHYFARTQHSDGSWIPRWIGSPNFSGLKNPVYGTQQVILAYRDLDQMENRHARRGLAWLAAAADADGGWGGGAGDSRGTASVEETAIAVEALLAAPRDPNGRSALEKGLEWLVRAVEEERHHAAAAIGLHPPGIWYAEKLNPLAFAVSALGQAVKLLSRPIQE